AASINVIARNAGISIGSMYSYFASKEDLFMSVMDSGHNLLEQALKEVVDMPGDLYERMDKMIEVSQRYAMENHQLNQIYIEISTEGLSHLARRISLKMESMTAAIYHRLIDEAKAAGLVSMNLDTRALSFFLDNLVMMVQFSYASDYYRERLKVYAGDNSYNDPASLRTELMKFIRNGLLPRA
ncbi:MAG: TetR/AcrR family transcriptional regulator, partial [Spirochaetes bacterium]|nr:TetR/AcrR family transcriptional regulator [Spirochaetota bacterium]